MPYKQQEADISELSDIFPFATNLNLKAVDHIDGTPAIRQLTSRSLADVKVSECWRGPCTTELRPNAQAPVHRLPVVEMLNGFFWGAEFKLVSGVVLHDYLKEEKLMASYAWILKVRPGYEEEYKRRHDELWPEMDAALRASGLTSYHIFSSWIGFIRLFRN